MPALVMHGRRDPAVPASFARRASTLRPNARLLTLDSGHFLPLNQPEAVASSLAGFFAPATLEGRESPAGSESREGVKVSRQCAHCTQANRLALRGERIPSQEFQHRRPMLKNPINQIET